MAVQGAPAPADHSDNSDVRLGDEAFAAERYAEAEQHYRKAAEAGVADLDARIERSALNAATEVGRGEHQNAVYTAAYARTQAGGAWQDPPELGTPPSGSKPPEDPLRAVKVGAGRALGVVGSALIHSATKVLGRNTNDRVWTNWYTSGRGLPGLFGKWAKILKLAHMRETLFANNLVRPYADDAKTGFVAEPGELPAWARRWRTSDGSWNYLRPDADGRHDPMVGAAYTRFFRNVGDDRGLGGVRPREDPATDPVSVRELSRAVFAPKGERTSSVPQPLGRGVDPVHEPRLDQPRVHRRRARARAARPRRPVARATGSTTWTSAPRAPTRHARQDDRRRPPGHVPQRGHPLVGRVADLRQRPRHPALPAQHAGGGSSLTDDGLLPVDPETGTERTGFMRNWWVGLAHPHHALRPRAQRDRDKLAEKHPDWGDEALFQTARLVNAAVMATIHTVEWTPAILPNGTLHDGMRPTGTG